MHCLKESAFWCFLFLFLLLPRRVFFVFVQLASAAWGRWQASWLSWFPANFNLTAIDCEKFNQTTVHLSVVEHHTARATCMFYTFIQGAAWRTVGLKRVWEMGPCKTKPAFLGHSAREKWSAPSFASKKWCWCCFCCLACRWKSWHRAGKLAQPMQCCPTKTRAFQFKLVNVILSHEHDLQRSVCQLKVLFKFFSSMIA